MAYTLLEQGCGSRQRIPQDAGTEAGAVRSGVERGHRAAAPEESGRGAAAVGGRRARRSRRSSARATIWPNRSCRPATTPRRRRATSWRSALDAKSAGAQLGMAQSLVQQGKLGDADAYFRQGGGAGAEVSRLPAGTGRPLREGCADRRGHRHLSRVSGQRRGAGADGRTAAREQASSRMPCRAWKRPTRKDPSPANRSALAAAYVFTRKLDKALPLLEQCGGGRAGQLRSAHDVRARAARQASVSSRPPASSTRPRS